MMQKKLKNLLIKDSILIKITRYTLPPLIVAIHNYKFDRIEQLVNAGAHINDQVDGEYKAPLMWAIEPGYESSEKTARMIRKLVQLGADINQQDRVGQTALMHAFLEDNRIAFKALLELGADIGIRNNQGETIFEVIRYGQVHLTYGPERREDFIKILAKKMN